MFRPSPTMQPQARSLNDRPNKRARLSDAISQLSGMNPGSDTTRQQGPGNSQRTRVAVACKVCRSRKTKCDSRWPVCSYCEKTNSDCQYDSIDSVDRPMSHDMGTQILQAIEDLSRVVKGQHQPALAEVTTHPQHIPQQPARDEIDSYLTPNTAPQPSPRTRRHDERFSEGLDSIFTWHVFPPGIDPIPVDNGRFIDMPEQLPPIDFSALMRLQTSYRRTVHSVNPILDLAILEQHIVHISENGLDWTTRTCLVALVCAIGALCQETMVDTPASRSTLDIGQDTDIAYRFWSVACKRLGRAMSHNTLESAQCLCLAGIWFMCNLQPLEAWRYFTMAGNCCYSAIWAKKSITPCGSEHSQSNPQAIEQSIFYTAYKSEVEIRYELPLLPGSMLEHIEDLLIFPSPPAVIGTDADCLDDETVAWYYFLADIAARHLINRILDAKEVFTGCPTEGQVRTLLGVYELFGSQLDDWYQSLPPEISFPPPDASISAEPNLFKRILRSRYLFIRELLCRPFVRLCLSHAFDLPDDLVDRFTATASLGLQYCAWRLQAVDRMTKLDHGLWIWVRNNTACSMILIGAARSHRFPSLVAAHRLLLPENWREVVVSFLHGLERFSSETRGGVANCYRLLCWGLDDFQRESPYRT